MIANKGSVAASDHLGELSELLSRLSISSQVVPIGGDVFVPLLMEQDGPDADLLHEGLALKETSLREVSEQGDVNRVFVKHLGRRLLLLVDGEQIVGAKQNRVVNSSFLVEPGSEVVIPVSCVERGRWRYGARDFHASDTTLTGVARSRKLSRITKSVIRGRGYDAQQQAVWRDVDDYLERSQVVSTTAALEDAIASRRETTQSQLRLLRPLPRQVGVALVREGKLALMDVFASSTLYARAYKKIASGMIADGSSGGSQTEDAPRIVAEALRRICEAQPTRKQAPGCGETLHGQIDGIVFGAVAYEGQVYHAVVGAA